MRYILAALLLFAPTISISATRVFMTAASRVTLICGANSITGTNARL